MRCRLREHRAGGGGIWGTWAEFCVRRAVSLRRNFEPFGRAAFWVKNFEVNFCGGCKR